MKTFTVIGYWSDSEQRFSEWVEAKSADEAEDLCVDAYSGLLVCGVIAGKHTCRDTRTQVSHSASRLADV